MAQESLFRRIARLGNVKTLFRRFSLRTQLLLVLLLLLLITIGSLSIIAARSEEMIIEKVTDNLDDITKAIQISVEEMTYRGDSTQRLKSYVKMLNRKGVKEISIVSDDAQVIASSNPAKIGTVEKGGHDKVAQKKDLLITARLGEESNKESQRLYNVIMPVAIKGQNLGYIHISMILDDYKDLQRRNQLKRILSMLFAFSIGIIVSLVLANHYSDPIKRIANASKKIAEGKLVKIRDTQRNDEIGVLIHSFNDMVEKLSERKELEEKLKKTEQLLMIGQLASGIAHEVRNPLNFLSLSIGHIKELLGEEKIASGADIDELLDSVKKEIYRVNELINNFLFLGKPVVLNREWISPRALMDDALYMVQTKVRDGIAITTTCTPEDMQIFCDREYMRMCLINLILNSAQAIGDGGSIGVDFRGNGETAFISVTDNGKGLETEDIQRIFEPYYSTKKLGIGLGLSITKRLVEEHGGVIAVESSVSGKTVITIQVPNHAV